MKPEQQSAITEILDGANDLTLATVRPDGYPQATTVSFIHDGPVIYFGCARDSQKALNLWQCDKVSAAVDLPYRSWDEIRGLSLGGRASFVTDPAELQRVFEAMAAKFPQITDYGDDADRDEIAVVRIDPVAISVLDYRKGFGHTEAIEI